MDNPPSTTRRQTTTTTVVVVDGLNPKELNAIPCNRWSDGWDRSKLRRMVDANPGFNWSTTKDTDRDGFPCENKVYGGSWPTTTTTLPPVGTTKGRPVPLGAKATIGDYWILVESTSEDDGQLTANLTIGYDGSDTSLTVGEHLYFEAVDNNGIRHHRLHPMFPGDNFNVRLTSGGQFTETAKWDTPHAPGLILVIDQSAGFFVGKTIWLELTSEAEPKETTTTTEPEETTTTEPEETTTTTVATTTTSTSAAVPSTTNDSGYELTCDLETDRANVQEAQKVLGVFIDGNWGPKTQVAWDAACPNQTTMAATTTTTAPTTTTTSR